MESLRVLTGREREVVALVCRGHANKEIARQLGTTEGAVKQYVHAICQKLGVRGRAKLILAIQNQHVLTIPDMSRSLEWIGRAPSDRMSQD